MSLFDDVERTEAKPAASTLPQFTLLNRSNQPTIARVRRLLDAWFSNYPELHQPEMRSRVRDTNNTAHTSAVFELSLHEVLLRFGCEVEVHPTLTTSSKHPDFMVRSQNGQKCVIEAIVATDQSADERGVEARMNTLYEVLNSLDSPNFFIGMDIKGAPKSPLKSKKIKSFLEKQLAVIDPDQVTHANADRFRWPFSYDGLEVDFFAIPKSPSARGKRDVRPVGMKIYGIDIRTPEQAIRDAVIKKAARYGEIDLPYIIAVNTLNSVEKRDVLEALFGDERLTRPKDHAGPGGWRHGRVPNGAWTSPTRPRYRRVSAVLIVNGSPLSSGGGARLYHNPWAKCPYIGDLCRLPQAIPLDGNITWQDGDQLGSVLDVPLD